MLRAILVPVAAMILAGASSSRLSAAEVQPVDRATVVRCFLAFTIIRGTTHDARADVVIAYWLGRMGGEMDDDLIKAEFDRLDAGGLNAAKAQIPACMPEYMAQTKALDRLRGLAGTGRP